jgi:hypothetical protein
MIKLKVREVEFLPHVEDASVLKCYVLYTSHSKLVLRDEYILTDGKTPPAVCQFLGLSRIDDLPIFKRLRVYVEENEEDDFTELNRVLLLML